MKITVIGDSVAYGSGISDMNKAWPNDTAMFMGYSIVNRAIGGSSIAKKAGDYDAVFDSLNEFEAAEKNTSYKYLVRDTLGTNNVRWWHIYYYDDINGWVTSGTTSILNGRTPIVDRISDIDQDSDIIILQGGSNDFYYNWTPFGNENSDIKTTFCGALNLLCQTVKNNFPLARIYYANILKRIQHTGESSGTWDYTDITQTNEYGKTIQDYNNAIESICGAYDIPVIDMFNANEADPYKYPDNFVDTDGRHCHPTIWLHEKLAANAFKTIYYDMNGVLPMETVLHQELNSILSARYNTNVLSFSDKPGLVECKPYHQYIVSISSNNNTVYGLFIIQGGNSTAYCHTIAKGDGVTYSIEDLNVTFVCNVGNVRMHLCIYDVNYEDLYTSQT